MKLFWLTTAVLVASILVGCGGDPVIDYTCDEPQLYQAVSPGKKVIAPEGLDQLDELAEMPIPKSENAPARPKGSRCIVLPPVEGG